MHIRAFVGAALIALCSLAFAPVAMADPAPDICVLNLSEPATLDHAVNTAGPTCAALVFDVASAVLIAPDDEGEAAGSCLFKPLGAVAPSSHRPHEDPGRCLA